MARFMVFVMVLSAGSPAFADEDATVYDFEEEVVDGDRVSPNESLIEGRRHMARRSLIEIRAHFVPELLASVENL